MKKLAVICLKIPYLRQLTETIPKYLPREWTVSAYENKEAFIRSEETAKVLLGYIPPEEREAFASENRARYRAALWLTDTETKSPDEIFMYRSVPEIAERVLSAAAEREALPPPSGGGGSFQVIGYIGAEGGYGCTTEAYRKAVGLASEGKTAFLCLDNTPGLKELASFGGGVSELMYLLKEHGDEWTEYAEHCMKQIAGMSVFCGVSRIGDATEFREAETESFLTGLRAMNCQNVVIDFGTNGTEPLLLQCDRLYYCGGRNDEKRKALETQAANGGFLNRLRPAAKEAASAR